MEPWTTSQAGVPLFPRFYAGLLLITEAEKTKGSQRKRKQYLQIARCGCAYASNIRDELLIFASLSCFAYHLCDLVRHTRMDVCFSYTWFTTASLLEDIAAASTLSLQK